MKIRNVIIIAILMMILLPALFFSLAYNTELFSDDSDKKTEFFRGAGVDSKAKRC